ncbi:DUF5962 family protein [Streptococcus suis]|uniref:DUF5962 family protein n=4 Tax=Streptococcus suis TaxID=1307 RepID=UPI001FC9E840
MAYKAKAYTLREESTESGIRYFISFKDGQGEHHELEVSEEWLAQGFTSPEDRANYQALKEQYEDETLDYSFSKREITGQLELIITSRENDFPNLDEVTKAEYLDLVAQLDDLDKRQADYYRKQLA